MSKNKNNKKIIDSYDYLTNAASATEFTGLTPTPMRSENDWESYDAIYPFYPEPPLRSEKNEDRKGSS